MFPRATTHFILVSAIAFVASLSTPVLSQESNSGSEAQAEPGSTSPERRIYTTERVGTNAPRIDGILDDPAWRAVPWSGDYLQNDPHSGEPPSQETSMKILYDDEAVYVAFRAQDSEPEKISSQVARRDWFPGDWVEINIDSYNDNRTAFSFTVSVSGVRGDEFVSQDGDNWDSTWDPVWFAETNVDDEGWTAEMKIPLSQLRFGDDHQQVWGIQSTRRLYRKEERSTWQLVPSDAPGWVSSFGELHGIEGLRPQRQIELLPYASAQAERFAQDGDNPFATGSDESVSLGLDGKVGLTSDLTVNFTINPDFGQVEADPSEVNLSAFETFFSERRPFFIEGSNILDFRLARNNAGGSFTSDRLFYSRRIGRSPGHFPDAIPGEYVEVPENTSILGAAKLTGKTKNGWSIGLMESVTAEEKAELDFDGARRKEVVEPLTNYFVGRTAKDFREGQSSLGAMFTAVNRSIDDEELEFLHSAAYSGGVDGRHTWNDRTYHLSGTVAFSQVRGDERAILRTQTAPARFYQRPDASHVSVDSTRTSLSGIAGSVRGGRSGNSSVLYETGVAWRSPGFETNDLGFLRRSDEINQFSWVGFRSQKPVSAFRHIRWNFNQWTNYDFHGTNTSNSVNTNANLTFRSNWSTGASITRDFPFLSHHELRGGPSSEWPGIWSLDAWVRSDDRRRFFFEVGAFGRWRDEDTGQDQEAWIDLGFRPNDVLRVTLNPSVSRAEPELQWVTRATAQAGSDAGEARYVLGRLEQNTAVMTVRLDYAATPDLSIQFYAQPFVSAGKYSEFKRIRDPRADDVEDRILRLDGEQIRLVDGRYEVRETGGTDPDYVFFDPDFNFRDFNSNLVARWEFSPGSLLYLVWSQGRTGFSSNGDFSLRDDVSDLFEIHPHNIFLIKVSRWFSL